MKKLKFLFTALLLMCCVGTAKAEEVTIDGIKYDVITKAKQATVIKNGGNYSGNIVIPSEITYNNVTCSVTSIGSGAFSGCSGLTSITIPNSVTSIESLTFFWCYYLTSIVVDPGNTKYDSRDNCNAIIETESNTLIAGCKNTIIPNSVTSIGDRAFSGCDYLTSITIPNSVTSIGDRAFSGCYNLESITIPNGVTSIGSSAFFECYGLESVTIGNSVTSIGDYAFYQCSGLTSVTIGNSVTSIGDYAFDWCENIKTVMNLSTLTFSKGSMAYGHIASSADNVYNIPTHSIEGDFIFGKLNDINTLVVYLGCETELTLPNNNVENYVIGENVFKNKTTITSVVIPDCVTSIGGEAFAKCENLTSVTIPNSVTSIGGEAFANCENLTSVTIPNSVTSIGNEAFANCENLTDVYCLATDVPATSSDAFEGSYPEYMTLHVPAETINSYKTTEPWSNFGSIIAYVTPKCTAPVIEYCNGELIIECETENAEFVTEVTNDYTGNYNSNAIALTATYNISVYATAAGYENSDIVNATLCWIECDCNENNNTNIINIPAKAVLVTSNNGTINISCSLEGEVVELYTSDAMYIGSTTIENGCATIQSGLSKGDIAIVKIGEKSIKVIID